MLAKRALTIPAVKVPRCLLLANSASYSLSLTTSVSSASPSPRSQWLSSSDDDDEPLAATDRGVEQVSLQHGV
jgi:hypothetical protein